MRAIVLGATAALLLTASPLDLSAQARVGDRVKSRVEDARVRGSQQQRGREARDDRASRSEQDRRDSRPDAREQDRRTDRGTASGRASTGRDDDWNRGRRGDVRGRDDRVGQARGQGPPFCANGQGHPVHGMRWCHEHGWQSGPRWERAPWGDVILRNPGRAERQQVSGSVLGDILGGDIFGRVDSQRRALGITHGLTGRWHRDAEGHGVLRISAGGVPVAEFIDRTGRGRADIVRINTGR